jgi:hypothetical protein
MEQSHFQFISTSEAFPESRVPVLIKYQKNLQVSRYSSTGTFLVQGYYVASQPKPEFYKEGGDFDAYWHDYAGRMLCLEKPSNRVCNKVLAWAYIHN